LRRIICQFPLKAHLAMHSLANKDESDLATKLGRIYSLTLLHQPQKNQKMTGYTEKEWCSLNRMAVTSATHLRNQALGWKNRQKPPTPNLGVD
jgi:hypothetical protein